MLTLHQAVDKELRSIHTALATEGALPPAPVLQRHYDTFRQRFGPDVLARLDGQELLELMHAHGSKDSLVYWLEFKADEEFPPIFGSIAGGSALKFGVYRRKETGTWATADQSNYPKDISLAEAISIARRHREQLLAAVDVLKSRQPSTHDSEYAAIQQDLKRVAPDVEDTAWGHKYLTLTFPELLDDFHVNNYQRYHLVRCLQVPPFRDGKVVEGRYECAGRFIALSRHFGWHLHDVTTVLNRRNGAPVRYWRVGTSEAGGQRRQYWRLMQDGNAVAIGWPKLGDLSEYTSGSDVRDRLKTLVRHHYPSDERRIGREVSEILSFIRTVQGRDRVVAADGQTVLGIGEVTGEYRYVPTADFPHQRAVQWKSFEEWKMEEGLRSSVFKLKKPEHRVEIERRLIDDAESVRSRPNAVSEPRPASSPITSSRGPLPRLGGIAGAVQSILERKGQAILYGPPGTGKTYWALAATRELAARRAFGRAVDALTDAERSTIVGDEEPLVRMVSFHPEYGYEDFVEGYRPITTGNGSLGFAPEAGVFKRLCFDATRRPELDFYLVIDEINRGDAPRVFGELLTALELDKRSTDVRLAVTRSPFRVPRNVFLVGTMNTADRSIALLDVALRRRFGFVELMPDYTLLRGIVIEGLPIAEWLRDLNDRIRAQGGGDARNRQIGHAFLLSDGIPVRTMEQFTAALREDIVPLLEEYCYDDFRQLADILQPALVDIDNQRVRRELFEPGRGAELISALMTPGIATATGTAVQAEPDAEGEPDDDSE